MNSCLYPRRARIASSLAAWLAASSTKRGGGEPDEWPVAEGALSSSDDEGELDRMLGEVVGGLQGADRVCQDGRLQLAPLQGVPRRQEASPPSAA